MTQAPLAWPRSGTSAAPAAPVAGWPFLPSAAFAQALRRLLAATEGLPLAGWEAACRLSPQALVSNRLLLGFEVAAVAAQRLRALPGELGMPADLARAFLEELPQARRILLAAEQGPQGIELKAYHEFHATGADAGELSPALAMRGRKWRAGQGGPRCTDYLRPGLGGAALRQWLQGGSGLAPAAGPALAVMARALHLAGERFDADFLAVTEPPSPRRSCCLRLYGSGLALAALRPVLAPLAQAWSLSAALLARLPGERRLGWLAAGTDALDQPFLTLYAESGLADARLALALGAFDEPH